MSDSPTTLTVGAGATVTIFSDSHACTIERVSKSGKQVWLRQDKATLLNGVDSGEPDALHSDPGGFCAHVSGSQRHGYEPNPKGHSYSATLRQNGQWKLVGSRTNERGCTVCFGGRHEHYDFNF